MTQRGQYDARRQPKVDWEIVLTGNHPDIFVVINAPEDANDNDLLELAINSAMNDTYIWSKKKIL